MQKAPRTNPWLRALRASPAVALALAAAAHAAPLQPEDAATATPIKHVIVIIGENRSFDHLFATYQPRPGQTVRNLLSEGIVKEDGSPGPTFAAALQYRAEVTERYESAPAHKEPYAILPPAMTDGAPEAAGDGNVPPFRTLAEAAALDNGILPADLPLLLSGATGLPRHAIDRRLPNASALPNGPYQLTPGDPL